MLCLGYNAKKYKHIDQYFNLKGTKELIDEIMNNSTLPNFREVHETRNNIKKEYMGTYIHRLLINHFASWYSPKYSYKIQLILDNLFKSQIEELKNKIEGITQYSRELHKNNDEKRKELHDKSVRVDIKDKKLLIIKNDNNENYKISCNSTTKSRDRLKGIITKTFTFPASLNIRQPIKSKFKRF
jgi:hypothetical protein